ncbi:hypothetical protein D1P53_004060 [Cryptococcus gattii VGV]|nr:hypothetical protein D1P53_004060 [Cryptococcus gattii VGV]
MRFTPSAVLATLFLVTSVFAQRLTTTLNVQDGDTLVISKTTNALGATITTTLSTIVSDGVTTSSTSTTSAKRKTTTTPRIVGAETTTTTTPPPMRTTTYWVDTGNGYWTYYTWTAPTTTVPTVATANVPAGTVQNYNDYQSAVNSAVFSSVQEAIATSNNAGARAQPVGMDSILGGWMTLVLGAVGAGLGVLAL